MCYILDALLNPDSDQITEISTNNSQSIQEDSTKAVEVTDEMEAIFISAIYSSLGAPLEGNSRIIFDEFVKKISGFIKMDDSPSKRASFSKRLNSITTEHNNYNILYVTDLIYYSII